MYQLRQLKQLSVFILCQEDGIKKTGSGNLIQVKDSYYVLTAAHCIQKGDTIDFYDKKSIAIYKSTMANIRDWEVSDILYNQEYGDVAALKISLDDKDQERLKSALNLLQVVEAPCANEYVLSGYQNKNNLWNKYEFSYTGECENLGLQKFQYKGAELSLQDDSVGFFKGMSGSGMYHEYDRKICLEAILVSTDITIANNNEVLCISAARFKNLIPDLQTVATKQVEVNDTLNLTASKGVFSLVSQSLLVENEFRKNSFIPSDKLTDLISEICEDSNDTVLLAALSGLGKTRLIYEAFKANLQLEYCFYTCYFGNSTVVLEQAAHLLRYYKNQLGMLIVDDCDLELFDQLVNLRDRINENFRIIGTNHDFFEAKRRNIRGTFYLEADDIKSDIDKFIDEKLTIRDDNKVIRDEIKKMADGYPQMAIALVNAYLDGVNPKIELVDGLMRKMLNFDNDDKRMTILKTLSLCQPMPYEGSQRKAFNYMLQSNFFTPLFQQVSNEEREEIAEGLVKRFSPTIIQIQSGWLLVRPFPLAVYFTRLWFEDCHSRRFNNLLQEIKLQPEAVQNAICKGFCKHIEQMHGNKSAYELVEKLVSRKDGAPFLNEEVLCSGLGSEFFLAFSHVNPSAIARCIWDIVRSKNIEWVRTKMAYHALHNIVFALERLCFAKESFDEAFKALSVLALAESKNEISSHANDQLQQLFHVQLAGTEVDFSKRLAMLKWLESRGEDYLPVTLECIDSAFLIHGFSRMCGSERFGLERKNDYQPKAYREVLDYWNSVRDVLVRIVNSYPAILDNVTSIIEKHVFAWFRNHLFDLAYSLIDEIAKLRLDKWDTLYDKLSKNRESFISNLTDIEKERFQKYLRALRPDHFIVSLNDVRHVYWEQSYRMRGEDMTAFAKAHFNPLVEEFVSQQIYNNEEEFTLLMDDKDYIDQVFIDSLVKQMLPDQVSAMFNTMLVILKKKDEDYSSEFMMSLCRNFRHLEPCNRFILSVQNLGFHTLYIQIVARNDFDTLDGYNQLKSEYADPQDFLDIYLNSFHALDQSVYIKLIQQVISDYSNCINHLVHFICRRGFLLKEFLLKEADSIIKKLLLDYNCHHNQVNELYEYSLFLTDVLKSSKDSDFAISICSKFIDLYNTVHLHLNFDRVFPTLLNHYGEVVWDRIAEALVSEDYVMFYEQVHREIGSGFGFGIGPFFSLETSEERVHALCLKYPDRAPICLSSMVPCYSYRIEGDDTKLDGFSSYYIWLLANYGDNSYVRSGLHSNLNSFSCTGSIIPYYNQNIYCYKKLLDMPNMPLSVKEWAKSCVEQCERFLATEEEKESYMKFCYGYEC